MPKSASQPLSGSPLGSPEDVAATARTVRRMFESVAPRYDFLNHFLSLGFDILWRRRAARVLRPMLAAPNSLAVDVCCGTGDLALALRRIAQGKLIAADFCHPMLQRARQKSAAGTGSVSFFEADTLTLPLPDNSVDVITTAFGFRNLANYGLGLREMLRVLKPSGTAAILEFSRVSWPVFGPLFRAYFTHVLPRLGTWISGVTGPYQYLPNSVGRFPDQDALAASLREAGFTHVRYSNFLGGVAALHLGEKEGGFEPRTK